LRAREKAVDYLGSVLLLLAPSCRLIAAGNTSCVIPGNFDWVETRKNKKRKKERKKEFFFKFFLSEDVAHSISKRTPTSKKSWLLK
jgi:hypothetical protein